MAFGRDEFESFRVVDADFDAASGRARFRYALDEAVRFEEQLEFVGAPPLDDGQAAGFEATLRLLHLAAGVSYFKTAAPPVVLVETGGVSAAEACWSHDLYDKGMREFAFSNGIAVPLDVQVVAPPDRPAPPPAHVAPAAGLAVPVGGGKDSVVVVEALRHLRPALVSVGGHTSAGAIAQVSGLDLVVLRRSLDPALAALNAEGALNGHVPITAIVSLSVVAAGFLWGWDTTVLAVEHSADEATRVVDGVEVNHQWSKTTEAEEDLAAVLASSVHPAVSCRSALRAFSELDIAACFATLGGYHPVFRSCNASFRLGDPRDGWCGACPKCRFVYLVLATAMAPAALTAVFGRDLLADRAAAEGFRDLLEPDRKPFECVGTGRESRAAVRMLLDDPAWRHEPVLAGLAPVVAEADGREAEGTGPVATPGAVLDGVARFVAELAPGRTGPGARRR